MAALYWNFDETEVTILKFLEVYHQRVVHYIYVLLEILYNVAALLKHLHLKAWQVVIIGHRLFGNVFLHLMYT